jgi:hypothetical protein
MLAPDKPLQPSLISAGAPEQLGLAPGACIIKLITAVIYGFRNKLECLSLNIRLDWKGLLRTNTPAFYGKRKLRP